MLVVLAVAAPSAQAIQREVELRVWVTEAAGRWNTDLFKLEPHEQSDRYSFRIGLGESGTLVAIVYLEVRNLQGDLVCWGPASYNGGAPNLHKPCHDLRVGHWYELKWIADPGQTLVRLIAY